MRILFINQVFPGQFGALAAAFAAEPCNEVLFMSGHTRRGFSLPGVKQIILSPVRERKKGETSDMASEADKALRTAMQALKSCQLLQQNGFTPDMVVLNAAWDYWLYGPEVFPDAFVACYPDTLVHPSSEETSFRPDFFRYLLQTNQMLRSHLCISRTLGNESPDTTGLRNVVSLPYPVDTDFFSPDTGGAVWSESERPLLFMTADATQADAALSAAREFLGRLPQRHMILLVSDAAVRARARANLQHAALDSELRLHLPEAMPLRRYRDLLRKAAAVIFMDPEPRPSFLLEAMSCGAAVFLCSSQQHPTVLQHGSNMLQLALQELMMQIDALLQDNNQMKTLRTQARATVLQHFSLGEITARHMEVLAGKYREWKAKK